ncbi:MAG: thioesterase family protein [Desulfobulbaceae bacterium]|nr:thioesterase family protein [Desulfobulbaceae bacterium]
MIKPYLTMTEPVFRMTCRVIYGDTDAGGVVYNANYLRYFEMGRTEMMRSRSMPYSLIEQRGLILPVTESYLRYKAPARYDDLITIDTCLAGIKKVSCRFHYRVVRLREDGKEQLLVKGFTVHACVSREGKLTPIPEDLLQKMTELCQNSPVSHT